ncbi:MULTISPECIES: aminodeoxychorismate synthase component I [Cyanophyceae]|uniref:aminodeoxychorismate synthase component I n=1 Tax=Cyanophyceae TaxID=3028117 RepID=UPI00232CC444|nr:MULTISPECIES: aminodeoxychorismate synthase component I [Cyanophyceae]MDB9356105.1 aminodeoxychorismate synthase component I [Nodularia spumigena CS-587/03]MDB9337707.1 aminodeoxychorismate synthase component I [Nodularia spumigena CS-589/07]MDB9400127.1 aminodeoxychorismate synthase component I [Microcystis aeruginosa CS-567/02-A1]MDB9500589.1 aminodeoxychorismate synthase component I [Nodularia spumigena CS-336/02]MDB9530662.1 aminodeoxychorismate synthase component I [Nodularia spumigena
MRSLIIDNYDSYTFNLYQMIAQVNGELPLVIPNDQIDWEDLTKLKFDNVVISPGPGRPEKAKDFGICRQVIENVDVPLLGVCLGHQGLAHVYGGTVIHAPELRHGRLSKIYHNNSELFQGIPQSFSVVRYHSLIVAEDLPSCLEKVAWTKSGLIMALRHRHLPCWGVQFHPESICTEYGWNLLENFRKITQEFAQKKLGVGSRESGVGSRGNKQCPTPPASTHHSQYQVCSQKLDIYLDAEQVFVNLFGEDTHAFWLDSSLVEPGVSRFSFMGGSGGLNSLLVEYRTQNQEITITQSGTVTRRTDSIFDYLKREIDQRKCISDNLPFDFNCGFVGYFGYEIKAECGSELVHSASLPDAMFLLADQMIVFDHQEQTIYLVCLTKNQETRQAQTWFESTEKQLRTLPPLPPIIPVSAKDPIVFRLSRSHEAYINDIHQCLQEIKEGESYQICLTNKFYTDATPEPLKFYRRLRRVNPAPYSAFLRFGGLAIACSSPERFLRIDRAGWVETKPIKGTSRRGQTPAEDQILREQLRNSEKDRAENLMIVDLLRNDLGLVCEVGSIHVTKLMDVETYATVHQLVSTIRGYLRADMAATDCIKMAFPGGSMTGAPKIRTMKIIDKLEQEARGVYSGAIGFLALNGAADLNIVIRTAVFTPNGTSIGIGGGIVALSDAQAEFEEAVLKAKALIQVFSANDHAESQSRREFL